MAAAAHIPARTGGRGLEWTSMTDRHDPRHTPFGMGSGFKSRRAQDRGTATQAKTHPGKPWQEAPGTQEDDCVEFYSTHQHNFSDSRSTEASPSAGWRAVYAAMGVRRP